MAYLLVPQSVYIYTTYVVDPLVIRSCCSSPYDCLCQMEDVSAPRIKSTVDQVSEDLLHLVDLVHDNELPFVGTQPPCSHFGFGLNV